MKQPKIRDLVFDAKGTKNIRSKMARAKKVKITINIDQDSLSLLRVQSGETGIPYQRLLNLRLKEALQKKRNAESRLKRLENDVAKLKQRLAA